MRHPLHPTSLTLLAALSLLACNKTPAPPKPTPATVGQPAPAKPPAAPAASTPEPPAASSPLDADITTNVGDPAAFRQFMATLRQGVQQHDARAVAALVSYPIAINSHSGLTLRLHTPDEFVTHYDNIITPHIAEVVAQQTYDSLFVNYQGAMYGNGEIWIAGICRDQACTHSDIRIRTIQSASGASN